MTTPTRYRDGGEGKPPTWILGVCTGFAHDASATLLRDGQIVMAVEQERLDRVKFGKGFPHRAIEACLRHGGISLADLDAVGFSVNPWKMWAFDVGFNLQSLWRRRAFKYAAFNLGWSVQPLLSTLKEAEKITMATRGRLVPRLLDHHLCHAAGCFYVSPYEEAAILTVDNRGEAVSATFSVGRGTTITRLGEVRFPDSLGALYLGITLFLGFRFGDEYKVMGLAGYGEPAYADLFRDLVRLGPNGTFTLNPAYFDYLGAEGIFSQRFYHRCGPRRQADAPIEQRHRDLACSLQRRLEDVMLHMAEHLHRRTRLETLCLAGGVAFNSVMNGVLLRRSPFTHIFVQPAAGDAGTSLGAALAIYHHDDGNPRSSPMEQAYLGPSFTDAKIEEALQACKVPYQRYERIAAVVAERLASGSVVGWFQGRMEWGPRALGARSILADPRRADMKEIVNRCIKHREGFRPFAPAVLEERMTEYFEASQPSPFMLFVYHVVAAKRRVIPAVTHVDGTARVQTVRREDNPLLWEVITEFDHLTGVPVVLNTSFNVNGEPIVCTPVEAIRCFFGSGLDELAIGSYLVSKQSPRAEEAAPDADVAVSTRAR